MDSDDERDEVFRNMIVIGVSFVVLAAVIVVGGVKNPDEATALGIDLGLDTVCGKTDHGRDFASLLSVPSVVNYFTASIHATLTARKNVQKGSLEECMGLIDLGIKQLEFLLAVRSENYLLGSKSGDVRNGLDAVIRRRDLPTKAPTTPPPPMPLIPKGWHVYEPKAVSCNGFGHGGRRRSWLCNGK